MSVAAHDSMPKTGEGWAGRSVPVGRLWESAAVVPAGLFGLALVLRLWAVGIIGFPLTEGGAYYIAVARNLVSGRGLVIDALWSYATPPLVLPRPAFELWQPMATFLAAVPMALFGPAFGAAQLGGVVLGAALAPLAWMVARDSTARLNLPDGRRGWVALGAGLLVAVGGPFLFSAALPDSTLPFTVLAVAACVVIPKAVAGYRRASVALGALLGLAYLTRLEAVYVAIAFVALVALAQSGWRERARVVVPVAAVAALVALPWWLRNVATFGTPIPGQITDNLFLTRNEQIFAYVDRPTPAAFLGQGLPHIASNVGAALWHDFVDVLLVPAAPIVAIGLVAVVALVVGAWRRRGALSTQVGRGSLGAVLLTGGITFAATSLLFPVATLWGTFEHASGPLLVGLAVASVIGGDAFVAWLVERRGWQRQNGWLAPFALVALTIPLAAFQLVSASHQAAGEQAQIRAITASLPSALASAGVAAEAPVITDRPIWLSDALGRPALALPDEAPGVVLRLAGDFGARSVVIVEPRGTYPQVLRDPANAACFTELAHVDGASAAFVIHPECVP